MRVDVKLSRDMVSIQWPRGTQAVPLHTRDAADAAVPAAIPRAVDALMGVTYTLDGRTQAVPDIAALIGTRTATVDDLRWAGCLVLELIGGAAMWRAIRDAALGDPGGMELHVTTTLSVDRRIPWELLHDGTDHVVKMGQPALAVVRTVGTEPSAVAPVKPPIRVLFVVGVEDDRVQAGAELAEVVRRSELAGGPIRLERFGPGTLVALQDRIKAFKPHVIHVASHGRSTPAPALRLDAGGSPEWVDASKLGLVVQAGRTDLRVVVVNACNSAAPGFSDSLSLAEALAEAGVPMVVGMAGPADDLACRAFAAGMYAALAQGEGVVTAMAEARTRVLADPNVKHEVDAYLPTLFARPGVDVRLDVAMHDVRLAVLDALPARPSSAPKLPVDRRAALTAWEDVAAGKADGLILTGATTEAGRWGRTYLAVEIMRRAIVRGMMAVSLESTKGAPVADAMALRAHARGQIQSRLRGCLGGLALVDGPLKALGTNPQEWRNELAGALPDSVRDVVLDAVDHGNWARSASDRALMYAIRLELQRAAERVAAAGWERRVVLVVDDLHRFGDMSGGLQGAFSDADWVSLCGSDRDLALVVTGIVHALDDEHRHGAEAVRRLVEGMRGGMRHEALGMYSEADLALVVQQLVAGEDWVLGARTLRGARPKAAAELRGLLGVALEEVLAASWPLGPSELRAVASAIRGVLRGWDRQSPLEGVQ